LILQLVVLSDNAFHEKAGRSQVSFL